MRQLSPRAFLELAGAGVLCSCSSGSSISNATDFPVPAFSDIHFDPFFDPQLFAKLNSGRRQVGRYLRIVDHQDAIQAWIGFELSALLLALGSIQHNRGASTYILFTGDSPAPHLVLIFRSHRNQGGKTAEMG